MTREKDILGHTDDQPVIDVAHGIDDGGTHASQEEGRIVNEPLSLAFFAEIRKIAIYNKVFALQRIGLVRNPVRFLELQLTSHFGDKSKFLKARENGHASNEYDCDRIGEEILSMSQLIVSELSDSANNVYFTSADEKITLMSELHDALIVLAAIFGDNDIFEADFVRTLEQASTVIRDSFPDKDESSETADRPRIVTMPYEAPSEISRSVPPVAGYMAWAATQAANETAGEDEKTAVIKHNTLAGPPTNADDRGAELEDFDATVRLERGSQQTEISGMFDPRVLRAAASVRAVGEKAEGLLLPLIFRNLDEHINDSLDTHGKWFFPSSSPWHRIVRGDGGGTFYYHASGSRIIDRGGEDVVFVDASGVSFPLTAEEISRGCVDFSLERDESEVTMPPGHNTPVITPPPVEPETSTVNIRSSSPLKAVISSERCASPSIAASAPLPFDPDDLPVELFQGVSENSWLARELEYSDTALTSEGWSVSYEGEVLVWERDGMRFWRGGRRICYQQDFSGAVQYMIPPAAGGRPSMPPQKNTMRPPDAVPPPPNNGDVLATPVPSDRRPSPRPQVKVVSSGRPIRPRGVRNSSPGSEPEEAGRVSDPGVPSLSALSQRTLEGQPQSPVNEPAVNLSQIHETDISRQLFVPPPQQEESSAKPVESKWKRFAKRALAALGVAAGVAGIWGGYKYLSGSESDSNAGLRDQAAQQGGAAKSADDKKVTPPATVTDDSELSAQKVTTPDDDFGPNTKSDDIDTLASKQYELPASFKAWAKGYPELDSIFNEAMIASGKTGIGEQFFSTVIKHLRVLRNAERDTVKQAVIDGQIHEIFALQAEFQKGSGHDAMDRYGDKTETQLRAITWEHVHKDHTRVSEVTSLKANGVIPSDGVRRLRNNINGVHISQIDPSGIALYRNWANNSGVGENPHAVEPGRGVIWDGSAIAWKVAKVLHRDSFEQVTGLNPQGEAPTLNPDPERKQEAEPLQFGMLGGSDAPAFNGCSTRIMFNADTTRGRVEMALGRETELAEIDAGWDDDPATNNVVSQSVKSDPTAEIDAMWDQIDAEQELSSRIAMVKADRTQALLERGEVFIPHLSQTSDGSVRIAFENGFLRQCTTSEQMDRVQHLADIRFRDMVEFTSNADGVYARLSPEKLAEFADAIKTPEVEVSFSELAADDAQRLEDEALLAEIDAGWDDVPPPAVKDVKQVRASTEAELKHIFDSLSRAA